jgi:flagellar motility protein MotE (MotC chaperone)
MKRLFRCPPALLPTSLLLAALLLSPVPAALAAPESEPSTVEERRIQTSIRQELARLRQKEEMLADKEMELKTLRLEVDKKLEELKNTRIEINALLERKNDIESEKTRALSKMYEKMEPATAAALLTSLDKNLAIAILDGMKAKTAGQILNNMDQATAAKLSTSFSRLDAE